MGKPALSLSHTHTHVVYRHIQFAYQFGVQNARARLCAIMIIKRLKGWGRLSRNGVPIDDGLKMTRAQQASMRREEI